MSTPDLTLYGLPISGHCHRVVMMLGFLGLPYASVDGSQELRQSPEFLALNPLGQIPVLRDGDVVVADSNAILIYLAKRYSQGGAWLPVDPVGAAQVQRWLSIAAGEVRFGPAQARAMTLWNFPGDLGVAQALATRLLVFMNHHLSTRQFLATTHPTIADLAVYSYIAHADEGRIYLDPYPAVRSWLARIEVLPGFIPMPRTPIPQILVPQG